MNRSIPLWMLLVGGCAVKVDLPFDGDADGLLDDDEVAYGTDPANPDSDDDGYDDGDEVSDNVSPTDPGEHPYAGGWPIDKCRAEMPDQETGNSEGDVAPNFTLTDQYDEELALHDFCGKSVLLVSAAFW